MQPINKIISQAVSAAVSPTTTQAGQTESSVLLRQQEARQQAVSLINMIFKSLKAIFPAWQAAIKDPEIESQARQEWLKGLIEGGINSIELVESGLAKCRAHNSPFLPSVGQFIAWCRESSGSMAGLPSEVEARLVMLRELAKSPEIREWNKHHPAIYWVYRQKLSSDWKEMPTKHLDPAFSALWKIAVDMVRIGDAEFPEYVPRSHQIAAPEQPAASKEFATSKLEEIKAIIGGSGEPELALLSAADVEDLKRLERIKRSAT